MSDKHIEVRPWRQSPFIVGKKYRVLKDFKCLRDSFGSGEILTYDSDAYSHYHSYTGYFFSQPDAKQLRVWDIHDDERLEIWRELFEEA